MRNGKHFIPVFIGVFSLVGCAASETSEETGTATNSALTQSEAFEALVGTNDDGKDFVTGHSECGHHLNLSRGAAPNTGRYSYSFHDCETDDRLRSQGTFKVVGGWLGGALSDPTLEITPEASRPDDDTTPWSYKIRTATGSDEMMPRGTVYLESTSSHRARLLPTSALD